MCADPIIAEYIKIRRDISRQFKGDLDAYCQSLKGKTYPGCRIVKLKPVKVAQPTLNLKQTFT